MTAPGWYADPSVPGRVRYWDGYTWTASSNADASASSAPTTVAGRRAAELQPVADALERLTALHREGALNDEEFIAAKAGVLNPVAVASGSASRTAAPSQPVAEPAATSHPRRKLWLAAVGLTACVIAGVGIGLFAMGARPDGAPTSSSAVDSECASPGCSNTAANSNPDDLATALVRDDPDLAGDSVYPAPSNEPGVLSFVTIGRPGSGADITHSIVMNIRRFRDEAAAQAWIDALGPYERGFTWLCNQSSQVVVTLPHGVPMPTDYLSNSPLC